MWTCSSINSPVPYKRDSVSGNYYWILCVCVCSLLFPSGWWNMYGSFKRIAELLNGEIGQYQTHMHCVSWMHLISRRIVFIPWSLMSVCVCACVCTPMHMWPHKQIEAISVHFVRECDTHVMPGRSVHYLQRACCVCMLMSGRSGEVNRHAFSLYGWRFVFFFFSKYCFRSFYESQIVMGLIMKPVQTDISLGLISIDWNHRITRP